MSKLKRSHLPPLNRYLLHVENGLDNNALMSHQKYIL
jgi:hypothetical protein